MREGSGLGLALALGVSVSVSVRGRGRGRGRGGGRGRGRGRVGVATWKMGALAAVMSALSSASEAARRIAASTCMCTYAYMHK